MNFHIRIVVSWVFVITYFSSVAVASSLVFLLPDEETAIWTEGSTDFIIIDTSIINAKEIDTHPWLGSLPEQVKREISERLGEHGDNGITLLSSRQPMILFSFYNSNTGRSSGEVDHHMPPYIPISENYVGIIMTCYGRNCGGGPWLVITNTTTGEAVTAIEVHKEIAAKSVFVVCGSQSTIAEDKSNIETWVKHLPRDE